jgi:hypothetical protein
MVPTQSLAICYAQTKILKKPELDAYSAADSCSYEHDIPRVMEPAISMLFSTKLISLFFGLFRLNLHFKTPSYMVHYNVIFPSTSRY